MTTKTCSKCKKEKDASEFRKHIRMRDGLSSHCKACLIEDDKRYYTENKEKFREYQRTHKEDKARRDKKYYESHKDKIKNYYNNWRNHNKKKLKQYYDGYYDKNKDHIKEQVKKYRKENPMKIKIVSKKKSRRGILAHYGMTESEYDALLREQGGVCAICGNPPKTRNLSVDHEHQSKEKTRSPESRKSRIRGLLCHRCNRAVGLFGNDAQKLLYVAGTFSEYITKYYAKRMYDAEGSDAIEKMKNAVEYLEAFEERRPK